MRDYARYIPHTDSDVREMLQAIGVKEMEDLFQAFPSRSTIPNWAVISRSR